MITSTGPLTGPAASGAVRSAGADEPAVKPVDAPEPVSPKRFDDTLAYQRAQRQPADLAIIPAEAGPRLIYVFRDPVSGETIRQYPTRSAIALGAQAGVIVDRQV